MNISDCRKIITQKCRALFQDRSFQETNINTSRSYGSRGKKAIYFRNTKAVPMEQVSVLDGTNDFGHRPSPKSKRVDGTESQSTPVKTSNLEGIYKSIVR